MPFQVVFDSTKTIADWWLGYSPVFLAFCVMTAYLLYLLWKARSEGLKYKSMLAFILVLTGVLTATRAAVFWVRYRDNFHYVGSYQVIEGAVRNYQFTAKSGSNVERFQVENVSFGYANHGLPQCFHKTAKDGGPIRDGLVVRIAYAKIDRDADPACIVRLEIPPGKLGAPQR